MVFDPHPLPGALRGFMPMPQVMELQATAADFFSTLSLNLTLNFTNIPPECDTARHSNASTIPPVFALHPFTRTVQLAHVCHDQDADPLSYTVKRASVPSWLVTEIRQGGSLILVGLPPASALNTTTSVSITVSDTFSSTQMSLDVVVPPNSAPFLTKSLPNATVNPGDTVSATILLSRHFSDAHGDALTATAEARADFAKGWTKSQLVASGTELVITMSPPEERPDTGKMPEEEDYEIDVEVVDPFGASVKAPLICHVRLTTFQKWKSVIIASVAAISGVLSIISVWFFFPVISNFFSASRKTVPCPLTQQEPIYWYPDEACAVDLRFFPGHTGALTRCLFRAVSCFSLDIADRAFTVPMVVGDPPTFCFKRPDALELNIEAEVSVDAAGTATISAKRPHSYPKFMFRAYSRHGYLICRFVCDFDELTKDWKFSINDLERARGAAASSSAAAAAPPASSSEVKQLRQ